MSEASPAAIAAMADASRPAGPGAFGAPLRHDFESAWRQACVFAQEIERGAPWVPRRKIAPWGPIDLTKGLVWKEIQVEWALYQADLKLEEAELKEEGEFELEEARQEHRAALQARKEFDKEQVRELNRLGVRYEDYAQRLAFASAAMICVSDPAPRALPGGGVSDSTDAPQTQQQPRSSIIKVSSSSGSPDAAAPKQQQPRSGPDAATAHTQGFRLSSPTSAATAASSHSGSD